MRKLILLAALAAVVAAPAALAKERNISMIGAPVAPKAGQAWTATLRVVIDGQPADGVGPMIRIVDKGRQDDVHPVEADLGGRDLPGEDRLPDRGDLAGHRHRPLHGRA